MNIPAATQAALPPWNIDTYSFDKYSNVEVGQKKQLAGQSVIPLILYALGVSHVSTYLFVPHRYIFAQP